MAPVPPSGTGTAPLKHWAPPTYSAMTRVGSRLPDVTSPAGPAGPAWTTSTMLVIVRTSPAWSMSFCTAKPQT